MKVAVYAICKNESKFVDRFMDSVSEADDVFILDTGSTDDTIDKLKKRGAFVKQEIIEPFRFDIARNKSLEMVPDYYDICVCVDLDEVISPGFRDELIKLFSDKTTRIRYIYNWKLIDNKPVVSFYADKIHKRKGYTWKHPVHEVLVGEEEVIKTTDNIIINHYPDETKSRSNYLELLE